MRVLVMSDIHANLPALQAVLADAHGAYDAVWCLGDVVGYGPNPNECTDAVRALPNLTCLRGNHDLAALGGSEIDDFNSYAKTAALWTRAELSAGTKEFLSGLSPRTEHAGFTLVHASPRDPVWEYIDSAAVANENFASFNTPTCLFGHTHRARSYEMDAASRCTEKFPEYGQALPLSGERRMLNPGSVGQPRDRNPEAAYALLDEAASTWEARRVAYPIADTQTQMRAAQLPALLIERLTAGR